MGRRGVTKKRNRIDRVKTRVVVLGSTGSIGTQALEVMADNPERFELVGISAHGSKPEVLAQQVRDFGLDLARVAVASEHTAEWLSLIHI